MLFIYAKSENGDVDGDAQKAYSFYRLAYLRRVTLNKIGFDANAQLAADIALKCIMVIQRQMRVTSTEARSLQSVFRP